jgi:hypothetical protein
LVAASSNSHLNGSSLAHVWISIGQFLADTKPIIYF